MFFISLFDCQTCYHLYVLPVITQLSARLAAVDLILSLGDYLAFLNLTEHPDVLQENS
jgi:hypothetical protein